MKVRLLSRNNNLITQILKLEIKKIEKTRKKYTEYMDLQEYNELQ